MLNKAPLENSWVNCTPLNLHAHLLYTCEIHEIFLGRKRSPWDHMIFLCSELMSFVFLGVLCYWKFWYMSKQTKPFAKKTTWYARHHSIFSGWAVVFWNAKFFKKFFLWNVEIKKNQKGKKNTKLLETSSFFLQASPPLDSKYLIIDNISISYNLMKHYVKDAIKIVILRSHYMIKIQSLENLPKEASYIYIKFWNIMNCIVSTAEVNFGK